MESIITDEGLKILLDDACNELNNAQHMGSDEGKIAHATMSIAYSNLIIAEMMIRKEDERNCK